MTLLAPDVLEEARQLSPLVSGLALAVGLLLWLLGGWAHRFWLVLATTLVAGLFGLRFGPEYGMQPLVAGLLLAVAAGALALSLVRVLVFVAVGLAAVALAGAVAPSWDEPLTCFLAGGLLGIFLFQFWLTVLASAAGTLLMAYAGLCLASQLGRADVVSWAVRNAPLLNWCCAATAVCGVLMQYLLQSRHARKLRRKAERDARARQEEEERLARRPPPPPRPWWKQLWKKPSRRAG
jgi:MFS family permease